MNRFAGAVILMGAGLMLGLLYSNASDPRGAASLDAGTIVPIAVTPGTPVAPPSLETPVTPIRDVALEYGGVLRGGVVDEKGIPQPGVDVRVAWEGANVLTTQTDARGRFQLAGLRGGVYQLVSGQGSQVYRAWTHDSAPPAAVDRALIVRGQTPTPHAMQPLGQLGPAAADGLGSVVAQGAAVPSTGAVAGSTLGQILPGGVATTLLPGEMLGTIGTTVVGSGARVGLMGALVSPAMSGALMSAVAIPMSIHAAMDGVSNGPES